MRNMENKGQEWRSLLANTRFFLTVCLFSGEVSSVIHLFNLSCMCRFTWRQERDSELSFPNPTFFHMTSHSQQSAPGNKLQPGQSPRGITEAGAETDESTPHPGKPSGMGLSTDDISSSCAFLDNYSHFNPCITLPPVLKRESSSW